MCKILKDFLNSFIVIKDFWIFCKIPQVYAKYFMILQDYLTSGKIVDLWRNNAKRPTQN